MSADAPQPAQRSHRRWIGPVFLVLVFTSPCWLGFYAVAILPVQQQWLNHEQFDPERWQALDGVERYDMAWDLLYTDRLIGKSQQDVVSELGPAMGTETVSSGQMPFYNTGPASPGTVIWYYDIGYPKYTFELGPSGALLAVDFMNGKVVRVREVTH